MINKNGSLKVLLSCLWFFEIVVAILIYHCGKNVTASPKATPFHVNSEKYRYNISVS